MGDVFEGIHYEFINSDEYINYLYELSLYSELENNK